MGPGAFIAIVSFLILGRSQMPVQPVRTSARRDQFFGLGSRLPNLCWTSANSLTQNCPGATATDVRFVVAGRSKIQTTAPTGGASGLPATTESGTREVQGVPGKPAKAAGSLAPARVTRVATRRDRHAFAAVPEAIYSHDRHWIAPLRSSTMRALDPQKNAIRQEAFIEHFVAHDRRGDCVGRVAAVIHPAHIRRHGSKAFFGQFECVNDPRVAERLLAAVEVWAADRGISTVQGPCTYTMTQEAGLLVSGFDSPQVALQAYNPPYYQELLAAAGYEPAFHMSTFVVPRDSRAVAHAMHHGDVAAEHLGLFARTLKMNRFDQDLEQIRLCYNRAFATHPETAAISRAVFADQAREMKGIVDPRLVRILGRDGNTVAFAVGIPNVNEILAKTRGRLTLGQILRFKRRLATVQSAVVVMVGADPEASGGQRPGAHSAYGIGSALAAQIAHSVSDTPYRTIYTTWIHDANWRARALMRAIGAQQQRRYAIFQKDFG